MKISRAIEILQDIQRERGDVGVVYRKTRHREGLDPLIDDQEPEIKIGVLSTGGPPFARGTRIAVAVIEGE